MHINLENVNFTEYATDICVIGAGAAGITAARRLLEAGRTVTILESGGLDYEASTADLNAGENVGYPYYQLEHSRLRFFGGTTAIWGGRIAELDPIDFEKRNWVPHSGWPLKYADLHPYYAQARQVFGVPAVSPTVIQLREKGVKLPDFDSEKLGIKLWSFDERSNRFTFASSKDLQDHPRCTIITNATVTSIESDQNAQFVDHLNVQSMSGRKIQLRANTVILAAGGLENPRLLLASNSVIPSGLGNSGNAVGRYCMEHPHSRGGKILSPYSWALLDAFFCRHTISGTKVGALITPSVQRQEEEAILNTSLTIAPRQPAHHRQNLGMAAYNRLKHDLAPTKQARSLWLLTKKAATRAQSVVDPFRPWLLHKLKQLELALVVRAEQAPNPDSRVTLSDDKDNLDMPRIKLDWQLSELDIHSVERLVSGIAQEMQRLEMGEVIPAEWLLEEQREWTTDALVSAHPIGGYHHMGTTRMSDSPKDGVTDQYGKVHGLANLYIAGSSLFPTSGWANPTLTIAALALRTADKIIKED